MDYYKVLAYIKETEPDYTYKDEDFELLDEGNGIFLRQWNLPIKQPEMKYIETVPIEKIERLKNLRKLRSNIEVIESIDNIEFKEGDLFILDGQLCYYYNGQIIKLVIEKIKS